MFTYIHLKHAKRAAMFPYPVEDTGHLHFYRTSPETHCYEKLEVCLRLSGESSEAADVINGREYRTPYPHVVWKMPGLFHSYHADDHRDALFFIYAAPTAQKLAREGFLPELPLQRIAMTGELERLIRRLQSLMMISEEYGSADRIDLACFAVLEELLFQRNLFCCVQDDRIRKIASLLSSSAEGTPDIVRIAAENGFSERSFYRRWKTVFPVSPAHYVMEQKMKRAAWLLMNTSMRVGEIAAMLSFGDDNRFSTAFGRFFGVSPREYRKRGKEDRETFVKN